MSAQPQGSAKSCASHVCLQGAVTNKQVRMHHGSAAGDGTNWSTPVFPVSPNWYFDPLPAYLRSMHRRFKDWAAHASALATSDARAPQLTTITRCDEERGGGVLHSTFLHRIEAPKPPGGKDDCRDPCHAEIHAMPVPCVSYYRIQKPKTPQDRMGRGSGECGAMYGLGTIPCCAW